MSAPVVIQIDPTPYPVRNLAEKWGKDPDTLNAWAAKGWIKRAFKHTCGEWWINPLEQIATLTPQLISHGEEQKGRNRRPHEEQVVSAVDNRRSSRIRKPI